MLKFFLSYSFIYTIDERAFIREHRAKPVYNPLALLANEAIESVAQSGFLR